MSDVAERAPPPAAEAGSPRRRSPWPLLLFMLVVGLMGYFVHGAVDGFVQKRSVDSQITVMRAEIADRSAQAEQLSALVGYLDSDEYIERVAREDLGLVRPGEEAFAVQAPVRPGLPIIRSPWWANLLPEPIDPLR